MHKRFQGGKFVKKNLISLNPALQGEMLSKRCFQRRLGRRSFTTGVHETAFATLRHLVPMGRHPQIGGLAFDLSGTSVDYRGTLVYRAVKDTFEEKGVVLEHFDMATDEIGQDNYITNLAGLAKTQKRWKDLYNTHLGQRTAELLTMEYNARQLALLKGHFQHLSESEPDMLTRSDRPYTNTDDEGVRTVQGFLAALWEAVKTYNPAVSFISTFNRDQTEVIGRMLHSRGLTNVKFVTRQDVAIGLPEPWLVHRASEKGRIYPPQRQIVFGDNIQDIKAARNAHALAVGVVDSSSQMITMPSKAIDMELKLILRRKFYANGAHYVISKWQELPELLRKVCDHRC